MAKSSALGLIGALHLASVAGCGPAQSPAQPQLATFELANVSPGAEVSLGERVDLRAVGTEIWERTIAVEVWRKGASEGSDQRIDELQATFDDANSEQWATARWTADSALFEEAGRFEIYFRAVHEGASLQSGSVIVVVPIEVTAVDLYRDTGSGRVSLPNMGRVTINDSLVLSVVGTGLVGQTVEIDLIRVQGGDTVLRTISEQLTVNELEISIAPSREDLGSAIDVTLRFDVRVGEIDITGPTVVIQQRGIERCDWRSESGNLLTEGAAFDSGTVVLMRAVTWGFEGVMGDLEIWEGDSSSSDDFLLTTTAVVTSDRLEAMWTAEWTGDGIADDHNEYYFIAKIGGLECQSGELRIRKP